MKQFLIVAMLVIIAGLITSNVLWKIKYDEAKGNLDFMVQSANIFYKYSDSLQKRGDSMKSACAFWKTDFKHYEDTEDTSEIEAPVYIHYDTSLSYTSISINRLRILDTDAHWESIVSYPIYPHIW